MRHNKVLALTAVAGASFLAGCSTPETVQDFNVQQDINHAHLPNHLPEAVRRVAPDIVSIAVTLPHHVKINGEEMPKDTELDGSGIRIGRNLYLTAGHMLVNGTTDKPFFESTDCKDEVVDVATKRPTHYTYPLVNSTSTLPLVKVPLYGTSTNFEKSYGIFNDVIPTNASKEHTTDVGLIEAQPKKSADSEYVPVKIGNSINTLGAKVYFENFEASLTKGQIEGRDPNQNNIVLEKHSNRLNTPAIYGGVVIKYLKNRDFIVVDGLHKSYGKAYSDFTIPGASGGAVLDQQGKIIGISVDSLYARHGRETVRQIDRGFDVHLKADARKELAITVVQPITQRLIASLKQKLRTTNQCA